MFSGSLTLLGGALSAFACSANTDVPGGPSPTTAGSTSNSGGAAVAGVGAVAAATGGTRASGGAPTGGGLASGGFGTGGVGASGGDTPAGGTAFATGGSAGHVSGGTSSVPAGGAGGSVSSNGGGGKGGSSAGASSPTAGAGGSGGNAGPVAFSEILAFIREECGTCHTGRTQPNLDTTKGAASLYTTLTTTSVSDCGGNRLVTPNDPSKSAILMVATSQCGMLKMPAGCIDVYCYSEADENMLTSWILAGAKNP